MRVCTIADIHGHLPVIEPCDLLIIAGDICDHKPFPLGNGKVGYSPGSFPDQAFQAAWLGNEFRQWLDNVPAKDVVATPGNHDYVWERSKYLVPTDLRWHLLIDEVKTVQGKKIYGSPWQHYFGGWAYNAPHKELGGEEFLDRKFSMIPDDVDIIIVHGPPFGFGDLAPRTDDFGRVIGWEQTGSTSLTAAIMRVKPDLSVHGHIHMGHGTYSLSRGNSSDTIVVNAAYCGERNEPKYSPLYFEI